LGHAIVNRRQHLEGLARLAGRNLDDDGIETRSLERGADAAGIQLRDVGVADERRAPGLQAGLAREFADAVYDSAADVHRMRITSEFYTEGAHRFAPCLIKTARTSSAARSTFRSDVSTTTCARAYASLRWSISSAMRSRNGFPPSRSLGRLVRERSTRRA